jgi:hypothetical protein
VKDATMRTLKIGEDIRQVYILDALRYTLMLENRSHAALWVALRRLERFRGSHPAERTAVAAYAEAWQCIDMTHRARGLARQIRGMSQKAPEFQKFIRATDRIDVFRNHLQHLNTNIPKIVGSTNPVLGAMSWLTANPRVCMTVSIGRGDKDCHYHTLVFDSVELIFTSTFLFTAGGLDVDLTKTNATCRGFESHLDQWLREQHMLEPTTQRVGTVIVHLGDRPPPHLDDGTLDVQQLRAAQRGDE